MQRETNVQYIKLFLKIVLYVARHYSVLCESESGQILKTEYSAGTREMHHAKAGYRVRTLS